MANGTDIYDHDLATKTLANLDECAPTDEELSLVFDDAHLKLTEISLQHDNFLSKYLGELSVTGLYDEYNEANTKYLILLDAFSNSMDQHSSADADDGSVSDTPYRHSGGGSSSSGDDNVTTEVPTEKPTEVPTTTEVPTKKPIEEITEVPTEKPTEVPTEKPTEAPPKTEVPTEKPTEVPTTTEVPTEKPTEAPTAGPTPVPTPSGGNNNNNNGGGWYRGSDSTTTTPVTTNPPTQAPKTEVSTVTEDVIKKGNTYKLPTSSKISSSTTTTTSQKRGSSAIPVLAGLAAAAAAGIGAKAYMDKKKNSDNDEEDFKAEDWSDNTDINIEYKEPTAAQEETLEFDDNGYEIAETEKYGARTHQELEDLQ